MSKAAGGKTPAKKKASSGARRPAGGKKKATKKAPVKLPESWGGLADIGRRERQDHLRGKLQALANGEPGAKPLTPREVRDLEALEKAERAAAERETTKAGPPPGCVRTQGDLAKVFDVSERTVREWAARGLPRDPAGWYVVTDVQAWREASDRRKGSESSPETQDWDAEYRKHKAQLAELELQQRLGEVVTLEEVERGQIQRVLAVREHLLALPRSVAPLLANRKARDIEGILRDRVRQIVQDFERDQAKPPEDPPKAKRKGKK